MEPLSHYCPATPATRILNENPELNTVVHNIVISHSFFAEMLFAIAVSEPRECLPLQQWNQVNTNTKRTCHNAHIIQVSIIKRSVRKQCHRPCSKICKLIKNFVIYPKKESHFIYFLTKMIYWAKLDRKPFSRIQMHRIRFCRE